MNQQAAGLFRYTLRDPSGLPGFTTDSDNSFMPLLRLETPQETSSPEIRGMLESARDQFVNKNAVDFSDESNLCPRLPDDLPFFALPEQQLLAYEKHRETSELGHVFRIANGSHDLIDALVVVGSGGGWLGAKALADACCAPYHNELTRAARGSKPRIYFADHAMDNDQLQSLTDRLRAGGYGDTPAETSWAIIAIDPNDHSHWPNFVVDRLVTLISPPPGFRDGPSGSHSNSEHIARLVTSVGADDSELSRHLSGLGFDQTLRVPEILDDASCLLSPSGLLSSAFLGLDCIQLLVGAAAINENFRSEPFATNLVLRFVAATLQRKSCFAWWARSLKECSPWLQTFHSQISTLDLANETSLRVLVDQLPCGQSIDSEFVCTHVHVDAIRTDALTVPDHFAADSESRAKSMVEIQQRSAEQTHQTLTKIGMPQNRIVLPVIDTHSLGQFVQLMLLSEAIRREMVRWLDK